MAARPKLLILIYSGQDSYLAHYIKHNAKYIFHHKEYGARKISRSKADFAPAYVVRPKDSDPDLQNRNLLLYPAELRAGMRETEKPFPFIIPQLRLYVYCYLYIAFNIIDDMGVGDIVRCRPFQRRIM